MLAYKYKDSQFVIVHEINVEELLTSQKAFKYLPLCSFLLSLLQNRNVIATVSIEIQNNHVHRI